MQIGNITLKLRLDTVTPSWKQRSYWLWKELPIFDTKGLGIRFNFPNDFPVGMIIGISDIFFQVTGYEIMYDETDKIEDFRLIGEFYCESVDFENTASKLKELGWEEFAD